MKTVLSSSIFDSACGSVVLTNCGRKAKKKIDSFGLRMLMRMPEVITLPTERGAAFLPDVQAAALLQRVPRHVEQVGDAQIFDRLEGECAGVQQRRQPGDGGRHMRNDAERATKSSDNAGARHAKARRSAYKERRCRAKPRQSATSTRIRCSRLVSRRCPATGNVASETRGHKPARGPLGLISNFGSRPFFALCSEDF